MEHLLHEGIQDTPFFLNYGRHPRVPSDIRLPEENPTAHRYLQELWSCRTVFAIRCSTLPVFNVALMYTSMNAIVI